MLERRNQELASSKLQCIINWTRRLYIIFYLTIDVVENSSDAVYFYCKRRDDVTEDDVNGNFETSTWYQKM